MHDARPAHASHDIGQVFAVAHFDREQQGRGLLVAFLVLDVLDVRVALGDRRRDGQRGRPAPMTQDWRLPSGGRAIDRARPLAFEYDGRRYEGYAGDTLASALLANGVHLVGRSFKYHRPRGFLSAGAEEPNALVQIVRDDERKASLTWKRWP